MLAVSLGGFLPRLASGPAAFGRTTRRLAQSALFLADALADPSAPGDAPAMARRIGWIAENVAALHGVQTVVRGRAPRAPCVLVANHLGYLDPTALCAVTPAVPIGKRELGSWPALGELMHRHGVLLVDRDDPYSGAMVLRRALRLLEAGASVLAFPEGTTTIGDRVLPFRRGVFGIARRAGVPVVPVAVRYESAELCWVGDTWFLPHYLKTTSRPSLRVELTFDEPIDPREAPDARGLAEHARVAIERALS